MNIRNLIALAIAAGACAALAGCASNATPRPTANTHPTTTIRRAVTTTPITHVIIAIQENRSLDNFFNGFPGADTTQTATESDGSQVTLQPAPAAEWGDLRHDYKQFNIDYDNGKMDRFDLEQHLVNKKNGLSPNPFTYVQQSDVQPLWDLAADNVLGDEMFESQRGPSYPAHLFLIAGQADDIITNPDGLPWGCDAPPKAFVWVLNAEGQQVKGPFPCFDFPTLADELDAAGVSWRFYAAAPNTSQSYSITDFNTYQSIRHIRYGPDWTNDVVTPETQFFSDVRNGNLASVTWLTPRFSNSDHAGGDKDFGPSWIASVSNTIAQSQYAGNTVIFVTWDDWGGFYDHVAPPTLDPESDGFRVPLLVISPYAKQGYVSHVTHSFGSILKFTEENWSLSPVGVDDARSDDLSDCFDFSQSHPLRLVKAPVGVRFFMHQPTDAEPPDDD